MAGRSVLGDRDVRRTTAWIAAGFAATAALGYFAYPALAVVWLLLGVFAVVSVPQLVFGWLQEVRTRRASGRDGDME